MTTVLARPRSGVAALTDQMMIQCGPDEVAGVLPLLRLGAGIVVTGAEAAHSIKGQRSRWSGPALADRSRYSGSSRTLASAGITPQWIADQVTAGVTVPLTDSGYLDANDRSGLATILSETAALATPAVAVLPINRQWLTHDASQLVAEINAHGIPIAVMVEHRGDPFSQRATVHGLVQLLDEAQVPVLLLRSDISALGAIAFGAHTAAFGLRSGLRHLYLPPKGAAPRKSAEAALWDPGLYMVSIDKLAAAVANSPGDPVWVCWCSVCNGRRLDWFFLHASRDQVRGHTVELVLDQRDHLIQAPRGAARRRSWRAACASAQFIFAQASATSVGWTTPPALLHWQSG